MAKKRVNAKFSSTAAVQMQVIVIDDKVVTRDSIKKGHVFLEPGTHEVLCGARGNEGTKITVKLSTTDGEIFSATDTIKVRNDNTAHIFSDFAI